MKKEQLIQLFGQDKVCDCPECLESYAKSAHLKSGIRPELVIKAQSAEDVEKAIKWANETKTPLVPVSSTGKHYRGGSNPSVPEAVMLDLSAMDKIRSINREFRMVVVEPGVTYGQLQAALKEKGLRLNTSLAPRAEKSVIADVMDVVPRVNPTTQWSYNEPLRCVEVVWGDGQKMATGEANGPALEVHQAAGKWQINPNGPAHIDYYRLLTGSQGTMGVITWASLHCQTLPTIHKMYMVPANKVEDLVDFIYKTTKFRFGAELFILNAADLASLLAESKEEVAEIQAKLPAWTALVGVRAEDLLPEKKFQQQYLDLLDFAQETGVEMVGSVGGFGGDVVLPKVINPCEPGKYWKETRKGAFADIFFVTTMEKAPKFVHQMMDLATEAGLNAGEIGTYIQPQHQGVSAMVEFTIPFDAENAVETRKAKELFDKASAALSHEGAYFSRPYGKWATMQFNKDAQTTKMTRDLKDIFNPNNILNPGKLSDY